MNERRDPDRLIHHFLSEGSEQLHDQVYDAVRAQIEQQRQRVVIGSWRTPIMNKFVPIGLGAAAVIVVLVVGAQMLRPPAPGGVGGAPSAAPTATPSPTPIGGNVEYQLDGITTTTDVDAVAGGASVSGSAVTTRRASWNHTIRVECAVRDGDTWAFGGTTEQTTSPEGVVGDWSAVVVRDGQPQGIGIWFSDPKSEGIDCEGWLTAIGLAGIGAENFSPVESGTLVPPPDLAP